MSQLNVNTINEYAVNNGVTIDGLLIKDGAISSITQGITGADQYLLTTDVTVATTAVTNWARPSGTLQSCYIGTGMTESSGTWSFPATGKWWVVLGVLCDTTSIVDFRINTSNDNFSSQDTVSTGRLKCTQGTDEGKIIITALLDVQDIANDKLQIQMLTAGTCTMKGSSASNETEITFIRLGDT